MFSKIKSLAQNVEIVSGDLMDGNIEFKFDINGVSCRFEVRSKVQMCFTEFYVNIDVSLMADGLNLYYEQVGQQTDKAELLRLLGVLVDRSDANKRGRIKELAATTRLWE
jgi:hypothetical protein